MNKVTAESRQRDSAVILFGPGDYCALTIVPYRKPRPIAEQLKAAQREAQEQRAPNAPKKKSPDRGDR